MNKTCFRHWGALP